MYRICTIEKPYRAEANCFLPAGLSACSGYSSTWMKIELGLPRSGASDGQSRLASGRFRAQRPGSRSAPSHMLKLPFCPIFEAANIKPHSPRGRTQIQKLRAANELRRVSADGFFNNNLDFQTQMITCED